MLQERAPGDGALRRTCRFHVALRARDTRDGCPEGRGRAAACGRRDLGVVERARAPVAFTQIVPWWCSRHVNTFKAWGPEIDFGTMLNGSQLYVDKRRNIQFAIARAAEVPEVTLDCSTFRGHWRWVGQRKDPEATEVGPTVGARSRASSLFFRFPLLPPFPVRHAPRRG